MKTAQKLCKKSLLPRPILRFLIELELKKKAMWVTSYKQRNENTAIIDCSKSDSCCLFKIES